MKALTRHWSAHLLAGLLAPFTALAEAPQDDASREPLVYHFVNFPPFHFMNPSTGQPDGLTLAVLTEAAQQVGETLILQQIPLNRFIRLTEAGKLELATVTGVYQYIETPAYACGSTKLMQLHPALYVNSDAHPNLTRPEQLGQHPVGVVRSARYAMSQLLPADTQVDASFTADTIIKGFGAGRMNLMVGLRERVEPELAIAPPPFKWHRLPLAPLPIHLCMNRSQPEAEARVTALSRAFIGLLDSPRGLELQTRYGIHLQRP